jgi:hypothetical protein
MKSEEIPQSVRALESLAKRCFRNGASPISCEVTSEDPEADSSWWFIDVYPLSDTDFDVSLLMGGIRGIGAKISRISMTADEAGIPTLQVDVEMKDDECATLSIQMTPKRSTEEKNTKTIPRDPVAAALYATLISPNESDGNSANLVDGIFAVARSIEKLARAVHDGRNEWEQRRG